MPVTARLLQQLHQTLGDEATNDLLAWWQEAATMNRTAIREVADLYFERFDARLEKGLGELRVEFKTDLGNVRAEIIKWMFVFWAGTIVPLVGVFIAVLKL